MLRLDIQCGTRRVERLPGGGLLDVGTEMPILTDDLPAVQAVLAGRPRYVTSARPATWIRQSQVRVYRFRKAARASGAGSVNCSRFLREEAWCSGGPRLAPARPGSLGQAWPGPGGAGVPPAAPGSEARWRGRGRGASPGQDGTALGVKLGHVRVAGTVPRAPADLPIIPLHRRCLHSRAPSSTRR